MSGHSLTDRISDGAGVEAGRELDALICEQVFGWRVERQSGNSPWLVGRPGNRWDHIENHPYSTQMGRAWLVVEAMEKRGWSFSVLHLWWTPEDGRFWYATFEDRESPRVPSDVSARETTAPLAICAAALAATASPTPEKGPSVTAPEEPR